MALINKTIGVGGDYADIGSAWNMLVATNPLGLGSDYTFTIKSSFTEATGIIYGSGTPKVKFNGRTVKIIDPTRSYTITTSLPFQFLFNTPATLSDVLILDGLKIVTSGMGTGMASGLLLAVPTMATEKNKVYYKNLVLIGHGSTVANLSGIRGMRWANEEYILNCKISNFYTGLLLEYPESNTTGTIHVVENNSVYNCYTGIYLPVTTATKNVTVKNTVSSKAALGGSNFGIGGVNNIVTNCADSDNSILSCGAIKTNNVPKIIDANEFRSLVSTSPEFLKLINGKMMVSPKIQPAQGKSPLKVKFDSNVNYSYSPGQLAIGGISPAFSTVDLAGNTYGKWGDYPIGCYNAEVV
jgi:hypothetical protein